MLYLPAGGLPSRPGLTSTFESPVSKIKGQLPKAGHLQQRRRTEHARLPNAICLVQVSSTDVPLRACWPTGLPPFVAGVPSRAPTGNPLLIHGRTKVATLWQHPWEATRQTGQISGTQSSQLDQEGSQEALLKHRQEVLSLPSCMSKLNLV